MNHRKMEEALVEVISKIAQHACRQGESGGRQWPDLDTLPYRTSWKNVGETYAKPVMSMMLAAGLDESKAPVKDEEVTPQDISNEYMRVLSERNALQVENARLRRALDTIANPRRYARKVLAKGGPK